MSDTKLALTTGMYRSSSLLGARVETPEGHLVGSVQDFVVDLDALQVAAVILGCDWTPRRIAIPASALSYDPVTKNCKVRASRECLSRAPSFRADEQPGAVERTRAADIYSHFCCVPYWF